MKSNIKLISTKEIYKKLAEIKLKNLLLKSKINVFYKNVDKNKNYINIVLDIITNPNMSYSEYKKKYNFKKMTYLALKREFYLNYIFVSENTITLNSLFLALMNRNLSSYDLEILKKNAMPYYSQQSYKFIELNEFFNWFQNHPHILQAYHYKNGSLPMEPAWFLLKAECDKKAFEYSHKRKWTEEEDFKLQSFVKQRKTYTYCVNELKRTAGAIKRRCNDLKITKPKREKCQMWTCEEIEKLKTLWKLGASPIGIAIELNRHDRQVSSMLERNDYFGLKPDKFKIN